MELRPDWKFQLFVICPIIVIGGFMGGWLAVQAADLKIPRKAKIAVTLKREKGSAPTYAPKTVEPPHELDRAIGVP